MGAYTSVVIYPDDPNFCPVEEQVRTIFDYLEIETLSTVSGQTGEPWRNVGGGIYAPPKDVFWEQDVSVDRGIELWKTGQASMTHMMPRYGGLMESWADVFENEISTDLVDRYNPWDTGFLFGEWRLHHHETGAQIAEGSFSISKSGDGVPPDTTRYLREFSELPIIQRFLARLEEIAGVRWLTVIDPTY